MTNVSCCFGDAGKEICFINDDAGLHWCNFGTAKANLLPCSTNQLPWNEFWAWGSKTGEKPKY